MLGDRFYHADTCGPNILTGRPMEEGANDLVAEMAMQIAQAKAMMARQYAEIERLTIENWQLKGALGYEVPGDIPEGPFKCGICDARRRAYRTGWPPDEDRAGPKCGGDDRQCLESYHFDDGVPYCDTCGRFRSGIPR